MSTWKGLLFHIAGITAIIWFLVRVVPAPHRARYPCQQVAMSISLGYIAFWSCLFTGLFLWMRMVKRKVAKATPAFFVGFVILFTIGGAVFATNYFTKNEAVASWDPIPKQPMGTPTGASPGRVVWMWNPNVTEKNLSGYWWENENNNQQVLEQMFSVGIQRFTGAGNDTAAWDAMFKYFNSVHGNGNVSYRSGEKIAIKLNFNNALGGNGDPYKREDNDRDASPYVVKALLRQLVHTVGVAQEDITLYDASRPIPNWFYNRVYYETYPADSLVEEFPNVHYVDSTGGAAGREKVIPSSEKMYFADGTPRTLPTCVAEATYLINMPLLKRHPINMGVTLSGKNYFGTFIEPVADIHPYFEGSYTMGIPTPQVDLLSYTNLGGKTVLYIGDGTFPTKVDHKTIAKFLMYPFNNDWTNSLFFSQDPVAMDSVMYDFLLTEGTNPCEGSQNYLHQAAVPSPHVYDPEHDGIYLNNSLGVHEHWDRTVAIFSPNRYSGLTGNGIDFQAVGAEFAAPTVVITNPLEKHAYFFGRDLGAFPVSVVFGKVNVSAQVNGEDVIVEKVEFSVDDDLKITDTDSPYFWMWKSLSFGRHTITAVAYYNYYNNTQIARSETTVWKIL
jgi:hypothetical protein